MNVLKHNTQKRVKTKNNDNKFNWSISRNAITKNAKFNENKRERQSQYKLHATQIKGQQQILPLRIRFWSDLIGSDRIGLARQIRCDVPLLFNWILLHFILSFYLNFIVCCSCVDLSRIHCLPVCIGTLMDNILTQFKWLNRYMLQHKIIAISRANVSIECVQFCQGNSIDYVMNSLLFAWILSLKLDNNVVLLHPLLYVCVHVKCCCWCLWVERSGVELSWVELSWVMLSRMVHSLSTWLELTSVSVFLKQQLT